jgi:hypothetical protein
MGLKSLEVNQLTIKSYQRHSPGKRFIQLLRVLGQFLKLFSCLHEQKFGIFCDFLLANILNVLFRRVKAELI